MVKKWTLYVVLVAVSIGVGAAIWSTIPVAASPDAAPADWTFQGRVYKRQVGEEVYPAPGVTVSVYGANDPYPNEGTLITSTVTDGDGWYSLTASDEYEHYHIRETDPDGYTSVGATSVGGEVKEANWIQYTLPLDDKTLTGNKFWDTSDAEVPLSEVPIAAHRYAGQLLEHVRGAEVAPGWSGARLGSPARPLYRPDVEGIAYYEFPVLVGVDVTGFVIIAAGEHDFPIAHWDFSGDPPTRILEKNAHDEDKTAVKFYKLDVLDYAAEDESGVLAATLGTLPFKVTGMEMAWLDQPEQLSSVEWTPDATGEDVENPPDSGTLTQSGPVSSTLQLEAWASWDALKTEYAETYEVFLEELHREAAEEWQVDTWAQQFGELLFPGETYPLATLCESPVITPSGEGLTYVSTELVTAAGRPPVYRITALSGPAGEEFRLDVDIACPGGPNESFIFYIAQPRTVYLPLVMRGSGASGGSSHVSLAATPSRQVQGAAKAQDWAWYWAWAGTGDQRMYHQIAANTYPNTSSCPSGCGATAWAMLFGWADYQAESSSWNYWQGRWGIYRQNGGTGANVRAPTNMDSGVSEMTWEIRGHINTFCAFGSAPTLPWKMDEAADYLKGRTGTGLKTHYSSVGIKWSSLRKRARNSILYRKTPAVIGTGWLKHYPLAYGYQWWSRRVKKCFIFCWYKTEYNRQFWVNQGWGGNGNGWIPAGTWFAGEIYP
jgi:hypothetical protein